MNKGLVRNSNVRHLRVLRLAEAQNSLHFCEMNQYSVEYY
jgi:hypothetical protein